MPAYRYRAVATDGKKQSGVIEADSPKSARAQLRDKGLLPERLGLLENRALSGEKRWHWPRRALVSRTELGMLTQQLATLLQAGLTVEQALSALIEQAPKESVREVLAGVRSGVMEGESLARAMERYGGVFNSLYRALVEAGELSGELPAVVERLAEYAENADALRQKTMMAFLYPAIVSLVAVLVIGGLVAYVVPQVAQVFQQSRQTLPLLTRMLIAVSDLVRGYWWLLAVIMAVGVAGLKRAMQREKFAMAVHRRLLALPAIGYLVRTVDSARLANTLAILISNGVPMLQALRAGIAVVDNRCLRKSLEEATARVREGVSLSRALAKAGMFPPLLVHLISSGETSGRLGLMLVRAARQQERELQNRLALLTGMLEPLLIVVMGGVVMLVVLAILLPIININQFLTTGTS